MKAIEGTIVGSLEPGSAVPLGGTYGEASPGELVGVIGSAGTLEVAVRDGSAALRLGLGRGARVLCYAEGS